MSAITSFFTADHRSCDSLWATVEAAVEEGDQAKSTAAFTSFDAALRRHLSWEEEVLFPAFEQATGMVGGPTAVMRAEHTQMRGLLDQMKASSDDPELLVDLGDTLLMLIQQHNSKEEQILYPMADRVMGGNWPELKAMLTQ